MRAKIIFLFAWIAVALWLLPGGLASWQGSLQVRGSITTTEWTGPKAAPELATDTAESSVEMRVVQDVNIEELNNSKEDENVTEEKESWVDEGESENGQDLEENDSDEKEVAAENEVVIESEGEQGCEDIGSNGEEEDVKEFVAE